MVENTETVGDRDEQVSANDMQELMDAVPPQQTASEEINPAPVTNEEIRAAAESKPKPEIVDKPPVNVNPKETNDTVNGNKPKVVGAAMPSDANVTLPESVSGEKEMKMRKAASEAKDPQPKKPAPLTYQDPILNMFRNPDGTLKRGLPQDTNKNGTAGRPTTMTPEILLKLEAAFCMGCTDLEACQFAGIGKSTLYNYQNEHPEFLDEKELWKENPVLKARMTVYSNMGFDPDLAMKYLERKKKDEFALRTEHTGKNGDPIETVLNRVESNYDDLGKSAAAAIDAANKDAGAPSGETAK